MQTRSSRPCCLHMQPSLLRDSIGGETFSSWHVAYSLEAWLKATLQGICRDCSAIRTCSQGSEHIGAVMAQYCLEKL